MAQALLASVAAGEAMAAERAIPKRLRGIQVVFCPRRVIW